MTMWNPGPREYSEWLRSHEDPEIDITESVEQGRVVRTTPVAATPSPQAPTFHRLIIVGSAAGIGAALAPRGSAVMGALVGAVVGWLVPFQVPGVAPQPVNRLERPAPLDPSLIA